MPHSGLSVSLKAMIKYILFDLDNTLYPESSILGARFEEAINHYTAGFLGVSDDEARTMRKTRGRDYGTTLQWLIQVYGFDKIDEYMDAVHPKNMNKYLQKNPELKKILKSIPVSRSILTNSPKEHALRVLEYLEILDQFERVFDLRYNNLQGKPDPGVYTRILTEIAHPAEEVLFIDDVPAYLEPFQKMGGHVLLIDELKRRESTDYPVIRKIEELPDFVEKTFGIRSEQK